MERVRQRLAQARRALTTLQELTGRPAPSPIERDAAIKRFEYTVEASWKAAQSTLDLCFGILAASPKQVVRACAQNGLLTEEDAHAAMAMIDDCNLTSHTYDEDLANAIYDRLAGHGALLQRWLAALARAVEHT